MQKVKDSKNNIVGEEYGSFAEFFSTNEVRSLNKHYSSDLCCTDKRDVKPGLMYTHQETRDSIMYGSDVFDKEYAEVYASVEKQKRIVMSDYQRSTIKHDVVGSSVSVGRALAGHPKPMNHRKPVVKKQKTVNIMFSIPCKYSTTTQSRLKCGCVIMAVMEILEKMDYQTALTLAVRMSYGDSDKSSVYCGISMKDYKTRFNVKKMQFPVAAEATLGHLGWWWQHRYPDMPCSFGYGEGVAVDYNNGRFENAKKFAKERGAVLLTIPMIEKMGHDVKAVLDYVLDELEGKHD